MAIFAYLLPINYVATKFGRVQALTATAASGLCAACFLYAPLLNLSIEEEADKVELALFCAIALTISQLFRKRPSYILIRDNSFRPRRPIPVIHNVNEFGA